MEKNTLLTIEDLHIRYVTDDGTANAVNGVSLNIEKGKTLGLVGETGAGKTTTALGILRLVPDPPGEILKGKVTYNGVDLLSASEAEMRKIRGSKISMIFQDPMTSLNPVITVGEQIQEVILLHEDIPPAEAMVKAGEMMEKVGISATRLNDYPHQFSGGMKQRIVIAMAIACEPELILADEPTTALDVTIQAQVLDLISKLKSELNTSMLLITHDLGVVAEVCDHVAIMYAGEIIEYGTVEQIFTDPKHPYTQGLFASIPNLESDVDRLVPIEGLMPDPMNLPSGCKFHPRCTKCMDKCSATDPEVTILKDNHNVRCYLHSNGGTNG